MPVNSMRPEAPALMGFMLSLPHSELKVTDDCAASPALRIVSAPRTFAPPPSTPVPLTAGLRTGPRQAVSAQAQQARAALGRPGGRDER
ncbi:hypothetical protein H8959_001947 [Pygathrix nigripes]